MIGALDSGLSSPGLNPGLGICGKHSDQMVSMLDSGLSCPGSLALTGVTVSCSWARR